MEIKAHCHVPNSRLDKAEQRISELKDRAEEITPNAPQKDEERENMKEVKRHRRQNKTVQMTPTRVCRRRMERMGGWQCSVLQN